jgi:hypothetical protein
MAMQREMQAARLAVSFEKLFVELECTQDQMFSFADHLMHVKSKLVEIR